MGAARLRQSLPDDVLIHVFEHLHYSHGQTSRLVDILQVCKHWHYLAQPILFRHLRLVSHTHIQALVRLLHTHPRDQTLFSYILSIYYDSTAHSNTYGGSLPIGDTSYVLSNAMNVQRLVIRGLLASTVLLSQALHASHSTLRTIVITVDADIIADAQLIGRLPYLEDLELTSHASWGHVSGWTIPTLRKLSWTFGTLSMQSTRYQSSKGALAFLERCDFPHLRGLGLGPHYSRPEATRNTLVSMLAKSQEVERLELGLLIHPDLFERILPDLQVKTLDFKGTSPCPEMVIFLHPSVSRVCVAAGPSLDSDDFWRVLEVLLDEPSTVTEIQVDVAPSVVEDFTWELGNEPSSPVIEFIGQLVPWATELARRGIRMIDPTRTPLVLES